MRKHEILHYLNHALEQGLAEQAKLFKRFPGHEFFELAASLAAFNHDLQKWIRKDLAGENLTRHFRKRASDLEKYAAKLSEKLWKPIPLSLLPASIAFANQKRRGPN